MASYHINAKIGKKGMGEAHAAYIAREEKYSKSKRYEDIESKDFGNMPAWAEHNPAEFWKAADRYERENGSVYREIEIALPREFSKEQRLELVKDFVAQELGDKHAYQFAIHNPKAALEKGEQPHAHIMYSERIRDGINRDPDQYFKRFNAKHPELGGAKKFSGGKNQHEMKAELLALREGWATLQNKHLEKNGSPDRVDHRSFKERGIDRVPEKHLGWKGIKDTPEKNNVLQQRAAHAENLHTFAEEKAIVDRHKKQTSARDLALSPAEKFKAKLAERAEIKAKAERDQRRADRDKFLADHAKAQAEQQRLEQAERDKAAADKLRQEQIARDKAAAEQQKREQVERDKVTADKLKQEQADRDKAAAAERRAQDKGWER